MDRTQDTTRWRKLYQLWLWFSTPRHLPDDTFKQAQAKQLTAFLFGIVLLTFFNLLVWMLVGNVDAFSWVGAFMSLLLYLEARSSTYTVTVVSTVLAGFVIPYILLLFAPQDLDMLTVIFSSLIAMLIASQFLSLRSTIQVAIFTVLTVFLMDSIINPNVGLITLTLLIPVLVSISLLILNAYGREQLSTLHKDALESNNPEFFAKTLQILPQAALIRTEKMVVDANEAALRLLNVPRGALVGQSLSTFMNTEQSGNYRFDPNAEQLTIQYDDYVLPKQSSPVKVSVTARTISYDEELATLIILQPDNVDAELKLLREIVDTSLNPTMVTGADLDSGPRILMVNRALCEMTGYEADELIGKTPRILQGAETERAVLDKLRSALASGKTVFEGEVTNYRKDGTSYRVQLVIYPVRNDDGVITHYISSQQAVTDRLDERLSVSESDEIIRAITELVSDYAYSINVDQQQGLTLDWIVGSFRDIMDLSVESVLASNGWRSIVYEDDLHIFDGYTKRLLNFETVTLEYRIRRADGSVRWLEDKAFPIRDKTTGRLVRVLGAVDDITERIETEETLRINVIQQAVVTELGLLALNANDFSVLASHATSLCEQVMDLGFSAIFEHQPSTRELVCIGVSGEDAPFNIGDTISDQNTRSLIGYALGLREPIVSQNLKAESRFKPAVNRISKQYSSGIGVSILGNEVHYGVLGVYSKSTHDFELDEIYFLQSIANVLGTYIERQRALRSERDYSEYTEVLRDATAIINTRLDLPDVLNKIMEYLLQVVPPFEQASIMLSDNETQRYHHHRTWGFPNYSPEAQALYQFDLKDFPLLKLMKDTQKPVSVPDVRGDSRWVMRETVKQTISYMAAPIIVQDECIGFINLHAHRTEAFSDSDALRLKTFADQIGSALINARRQQELEQKVAQRTAELQQEREQLEAIFAGTGDGIFYTEQNMIQFVNQTLCDMTGYQSNDLIGSISTILLPDDSTPSEQEKINSIRPEILRGATWRDTLRVARADGSTFMANLTISRVGPYEDDVLRAVAIVRDISREQEVEELKQRFISTAAHELRSPIASMKTRMFLIKRDPEQLHYHLERLEYIIDRMNRLVSDLLDVSSFEHGRIILRKVTIVVQDVLDIVVDILSLEAEQVGLAFEYISDKSPIMVLADAHRLEQVFINLIGNAINYTESGGKITVGCAVQASDETVTISVKDTGRGISADDIDRIFLPFYRADKNDKKGTGLGLSITRDIVRLHDGKVIVESEVGKGSTFSIVLPVTSAE